VVLSNILFPKAAKRAVGIPLVVAPDIGSPGLSIIRIKFDDLRLVAGVVGRTLRVESVARLRDRLVIIVLDDDDIIVLVELPLLVLEVAQGRPPEVRIPLLDARRIVVAVARIGPRLDAASPGRRRVVVFM
jgi:hypothetical protein